MSQSSLNGTAEIEEDATAVYQAQLTDENSVNLLKTAISTATLRVINVDDGAVIQADTTILASINATGLLNVTLPASYFQFSDTTKLPLAIERKQIIFTIGYSGKKDVHHLVVRVNRSQESS